MKFVSTHLTKHHLLHAPHRWFLAVLLSPFHAAEIHYEKKYHLQFKHARKLFIFDLTLLLSAIFLACITAYFFLSHPTIVDKINITIDLAPHEAATIEPVRIRSGEHITYQVTYENTTNVALHDAELIIHLPDNFIAEKETTNNDYRWPIGTIAPHTVHRKTITGFIFSQPNSIEHTAVELRYQPEGSSTSETAAAAMLLTTKGSILETKISVPKNMAAESVATSTIAITNTYHHPIGPLVVALGKYADAKLTPLFETLGNIGSNGLWSIDSLAPNQTATLTFQTNITAKKNTDSLELQIVPSVLVHDHWLEQAAANPTITVVHPEIHSASTWTATEKNNIKKLSIQIENTGSLKIDNLVATLPMPEAAVNVSLLKKINPTVLLRGDNLEFSSATNAELLSLLPGKKINLAISVPLLPQPEIMTLTPVLQLSGTVSGLENTPIIFNETLSTLNLGTYLSLSAEARYYTADGDQLGRGPLPPHVNETTRYWIFLRLKNGAGVADNIILNAHLPEGIVWTGKTSVSQDQDVRFNSTNRQITWTTKVLEPHALVGIYFEVAYTPTELDRGKNSTLLNDIFVQGHDESVSRELSTNAPAITSALIHDITAQKRGVLVQ